VLTPKRAKSSDAPTQEKSSGRKVYFRYTPPCFENERSGRNIGLESASARFFDPQRQFFFSPPFCRAERSRSGHLVDMAKPSPYRTGHSDMSGKGRAMAKKSSSGPFLERLYEGYAQSLSPSKILVDETSRFQAIKIFDTPKNGRVMMLDDIVQITTRDESAYAEMLTHLPLLEHGKAERVMIVGGGDLSIADEALKHKAVREVVLVDIDEQVVAHCKKHFGEINAKAAKDKRLKIEIADAFEYLGRPESKARFDLIVADRPDPIGPGTALFGETFYERVKRALRPGGFATFQTGVPFYQPSEITDALKELKRHFPKAGIYLTVVPTYIGGFMALAWAGKGKTLGTPAGIKAAARRFRTLKLRTDYYNPSMHGAAFALPEWIKRLVK
jgi:spermidine synthase